MKPLSTHSGEAFCVRSFAEKLVLIWRKVSGGRSVSLEQRNVYQESFCSHPGNSKGAAGDACFAGKDLWGRRIFREKIMKENYDKMQTVSSDYRVEAREANILLSALMG